MLLAYTHAAGLYSSHWPIPIHASAAVFHGGTIRYGAMEQGTSCVSAEEDQMPLLVPVLSRAPGYPAVNVPSPGPSRHVARRKRAREVSQVLLIKKGRNKGRAGNAMSMARLDGSGIVCLCMCAYIEASPVALR